MSGPTLSRAELRDAIGMLRNDVEALHRGNALRDAELLFRQSPFSEEGRELVLQYLQRNPSDPPAQHHLAIQAHSMAFELERSGEAFDDAFIAAYKCWKDVLENDEFWAALQARGQDLGGERFDSGELMDARETMADWMLEIHSLAVLKHYQQDMDRARHHMRIILKAPFLAESETHRERVFQEFDEAAQRILQSGGDQSAQAAEVIETYLELDPDYGPANVETVRLLNEVCHPWCVEGYLRRARDTIERATLPASRIKGLTESRAVSARARHLAYRAFVELADGSPTAARRSLDEAKALAPAEQIAREISEMLSNYLEATKTSDMMMRTGNSFDGHLKKAYSYAQIRQFELAIAEISKIRHQVVDVDPLDEQISTWRDALSKATME